MRRHDVDERAPDDRSVGDPTGLSDVFGSRDAEPERKRQVRARPDTARQVRDLGRQAIAILEEQLRHFTRLTVELLEIARIDSGQATLELSDVDVNALVARVLAQSGVDRAVLRTERDVHMWRLDPTRLERVVANLVENADRYAGGVTGVAICEEDDELRITVDDAGPGIPEADRLAIFGRFNRGSMGQPADRPKGTGLGLALVDEHVRLHGGEVFATGNPAGGARFVVSLPRRT